MSILASVEPEEASDSFMERLSLPVRTGQAERARLAPAANMDWTCSATDGCRVAARASIPEAACCRPVIWRVNGNYRTDCTLERL